MEAEMKVALEAEYADLKKKNIKLDGDPRMDHVPQELARMKEIERDLGGEPVNEADNLNSNGTAKMPEMGAGAKQKAPAESAGETDAEKIKRLTRENKALENRQARSAGANKIKNAHAKNERIRRADEIMDEAMEDAEDRDPVEWDDSNKLAVERTIRKFVRKGGSVKDQQKGGLKEVPAGFRKGISLAEKEFAIGLLNDMGRLAKGKSYVLDLVKENEKQPLSVQRMTKDVFNAELEELGVSWDESIQVPGFSDQLK